MKSLIFIMIYKKLFPPLICLGKLHTEMKNVAVRQTVTALFEQDSWPPITEEVSDKRGY